MLGFCVVEVNEFGPLQLQFAPVMLVILRLSVCPVQIGLLAVGVSVPGGGVFTATATVCVALVQPLTVMLSE